MKEQMTYVAVDADNVGESVGNAVLSNDTNRLSSISEGINSGVQIFSKWAEFNGGKTISNGSDEIIIQVPVSSISELENLKIEYANKSGFSVSIGIGETVSEAAKALIYAKMNGKDQIMDYSPEMEQTMKQTISGDYDQEEQGQQEQLPEGSEEVPEHEANLSEEEKALHDSTESMSDEQEVEQEQLADQAEEDQLVPQSEESELPIEGEENSEEALDELVDSNDPSEEDIDLDGTPDQQEEHGEIEPSMDDIDQDGDVEHEEAMAAEAGEEEIYSDEADMEDDSFGEEDLSDSIASEMSSEEQPEEFAEESEEDNMLSEEDEAMQGQFAEEIPQDEQEQVFDEEEAIEQDMEADMGEEGSDHDSLKDVIFESLQNFKQNRQHLESISQENPELYNALIYCLQAMIEMAKELGYGGAVDELEAQDSEEGFPQEEQGQPEEMMEEGEEQAEESFPEEEKSEEESEEESEDEDMPFEKNEKFIGLIHKIGKMTENFKNLNVSLSKDEKESMEEIKENIKKKAKDKLKAKSKSKPGKRKAKSNKPIKPGKKKPQSKQSNDGSFCAKSHLKMRSSGKDCRANEDKDSPLCSARRKFNCRGKNEEKNKKFQKSETLMKARVDDGKSEKEKARARYSRNERGIADRFKQKKEKGVNHPARPKGKGSQGTSVAGLNQRKWQDPKRPSNVSDAVEQTSNDIGKKNAKKIRTQNIKELRDIKPNLPKSEGLEKNTSAKSEHDVDITSSKKLAKFLKKKDCELEKSRTGTATKQTTKHVTKPQNPEGTKKGYKVKVVDNETGIARWIDGSRGLAKDPKGDAMSPPGKSPLSAHPQKVPKTVKE